MIGGGEFIINGAERVVVSQLHRSPGRRLRRRDRGRRPQAARLPHHPRARQLDRARVTKKDDPRRPHRPVGQVLGDDAAAGDEPRSTPPTRRSSRRSTRPRRSTTPTPRPPRQLEGRIACRRRRRPGDRRGPASRAARPSPRPRRRSWPTPTWATILVLKEVKDPLILNIAARKTPTTSHEEALLQDLRSGCGPATRRSWRRPGSCSTRSSSTPTATASAASAASASTASSTRTSPRR